jgi:cystathionine beta-synthase
MNLLDTVGNTPLVKLNHFGKEYGNNIYVKLEYFNPTSSLKDRIAKGMIEEAEKKGIIKPGDTIIENSSGNTATGLAMVAKQKGYKLILVVRDTLSIDKRRVLEAFGVELIFSDSSLPVNHPMAYHNLPGTYAKQHKGVWFSNQHDNLDNPLTHYRTTGQEIWEQTGQKVDYFVAGMGTGGTLSGIGKALKEKNPNVKIIGVDPIGSVFKAHYYQEKLPEPHSHHLEGIGNAFPTTNIIREYIDEVLELKDTEALKLIRELIKTEGIIGGPSVGANLWGVLEIAKRNKGKNLNIVTLIGDTGYKYTSTIFNDEWLKKVFEKE